MNKLCVACGVEFSPCRTTPYQKYCSSKCRDKINNQIKVITGKKKISDALYRERNKEFIKEVNSIYKDKIRFSDGSGSKSLNRKTTLERDNYICQMCGENECKKLIVHHNTYPANVDNLVTLCRSCHIRVHQYLDGKFYPARNVGEQ